MRGTRSWQHGSIDLSPRPPRPHPLTPSPYRERGNQQGSPARPWHGGDAAIVAAEHEPDTLEFVCLDDRLSEAAGREGFRLVDPAGFSTPPQVLSGARPRPAQDVLHRQPHAGRISRVLTATPQTR
jgi:hypothetical protein